MTGRFQATKGGTFAPLGGVGMMTNIGSIVTTYRMAVIDTGEGISQYKNLAPRFKKLFSCLTQLSMKF